MLSCLILIGVISANGNFKVGTDGKMECTGAKIKVEDTGINSGQPMVAAESATNINGLYSDGLYIEDKNSDNSNFAMFTPNQITALNESRYGFDFGIGSDGKIIWIVKDKDGKIINVSDTQFNLYSPGQATNLMLSSNGAYINGYKIQTNTSDARLKDNIQDSIENALEKIMKIRHRSFEWKESGEHQKNGYIAQELEEIDRGFVINENDKYSINVLNLLATVTKAIQEQQKQIENLQKEIENLKGAK